jgi:hypothetical protein
VRPRLPELALLLIPLLALVLAFAWVQPVPAEDACILFRYADHLAAGHGIVWNLGEDPVEGATEFLWLLVLAALSWAGADLLSASRAAGLAFAAAGAILLFMGSRRVLRTGVLPALIVSVTFAASTPSLHAGTGFGTPLYTLLLLAAFLLVWRLAGKDDPGRAEVWLPVTLLLLGLARPEGVLAGACFYAALFICRPAILTRAFLARQAALLLLPGLIYFVWRWWYFGWPLPNTFYVKSFDGLLNQDSARRIARFLVKFGFAPIALTLVACPAARPAERRRLLALGAVALVTMAAYLRFAMIQDLGFRFVFPSWALLLAVSAAALDRLMARRGVLRLAAAPLAAVLIASGPWMLRASGYRGTYDDRFHIGRALAGVPSGPHTMMATEAGYLPWLSGWRAIDPFGLNDEHVAHHGLSEQYIEARRPDLIMFHVDTAEYRERWTPPGADRWEAMTKMLHRFATSRGYVHAATIPKSNRPEDGYHWYFVRPDIADGIRITDLIRQEAGDARAR